MHTRRLSMVCLALALVAGCATTQPATVSEGLSGRSPQQQVRSKDLVEVVCKAAYPQGCRHLGYVYPWNAWLDISGYDSADYNLIEIKRSGSQATLYLEKLKSD